MGRRARGAPLTGALARSLAGPVLPAARALLGCRLTGSGVTVRLTEVEAYDGERDPASHAYRGRTPRNAVMYGPAGVAYVYFTYGMHWCLNVVTGPVGRASAVLLRAGEVVDGLALAAKRRGAAGRSTVERDVPERGVAERGVPERELARGPARLARALGIDGTAGGTNLLDGTGPLLLAPAAARIDLALVRSGPRVGVSGGHDVPWRFWLDGEPTVSAYRRHTPRRRATGQAPG